MMERANRTFREALDGHDLGDYYELQDALTRIIRWYNEERLQYRRIRGRPATQFHPRYQCGFTASLLVCNPAQCE